MLVFLHRTKSCEKLARTQKHAGTPIKTSEVHQSSNVMWVRFALSLPLFLRRLPSVSPPPPPPPASPLPPATPLAPPFILPLLLQALRCFGIDAGAEAKEEDDADEAVKAAIPPAPSPSQYDFSSAPTRSLACITLSSAVLADPPPAPPLALLRTAPAQDATAFEAVSGSRNRTMAFVFPFLKSTYTGGEPNDSNISLIDVRVPAFGTFETATNTPGTASKSDLLDAARAFLLRF